MGQLKHLWVEAYRPATVEDYIFQDKNQRLGVLNMLKEQSIPHLLFTGTAGSGKTSLAFMLLNELEIDKSDIMIINASDENNVDTMRDKIKSFISTWAVGDYKVVVLEEADYLTLNAQGVLRRMMEEYSNAARFVLTANYEHKIIPAIRSRCQHFVFKSFPKKKIRDRIINILLQEDVVFTEELVDKYVSAGYPDIRKTIHLIQQNTINNELRSMENGGTSVDYKFKLLELLELDSWSEIRTLLCNEVQAEEWEDVYKFMYDNVHKAPKFSSQTNWEQAIVTIADHLYKHSVVADPMINAAAMFIRLGQI